MDKYSIEHPGITVSNLENSISFYKNNFGFEEIKRADKPDLEVKLATLELNGSSLELLQPYKTRIEIDLRKKDSLKEILQKIPLFHLAIKVDNLNSVYKKLKENNVELITEFNEKFFFCKDLDGYLIEVRQK